MREETRQVTIDSVVYVADDGREFTNADDCEAYEMRCAAKVLKMFNFVGAPCTQADDCEVVKLTTKREVETFIRLCRYDGVSHRGIEGSGVYIYTEGAYGKANIAWTEISGIIDRLKEREDIDSGN